MKCYRIFQSEPFGEGKLCDIDPSELSPGDVQIEVHYSSINFKDALAARNKGKILKKYPLNGGIDCAGVVSKSDCPEFKEGDKVIVNGSTLSEWADGGYGEFVNVKSEWVVPLPDGLSLKEAMIYGTAGFTAALCIERMLQNHQTPEKGPILVTGASGGVGTLSLLLLSHLGFETVALSGKDHLKEKLKGFGASKVQTLEELELGDRPLESARFGGAIDNVGGDVLAKVISHVDLWGSVASVGLAQSHKLQTTVMPFILRGVSLLGASSNNCPQEMRKDIWKKLGLGWKPDNIEDVVSHEVGLDEMEPIFDQILERKAWGRSIVRIKS